MAVMKEEEEDDEDEEEQVLADPPGRPGVAGGAMHDHVDRASALHKTLAVRTKGEFVSESKAQMQMYISHMDREAWTG